MQIEVYLSETSNPTNKAILHLLLLGRIIPAQANEGLGSDYPSWRNFDKESRFSRDDSFIWPSPGAQGGRRSLLGPPRQPAMRSLRSSHPPLRSGPLRVRAALYGGPLPVALAAHPAFRGK